MVYPAPMETEPLITPLEARILGSLMEKELATPEHYPLTLSSLLAACCQKSNRHPVMELDSATVDKALGVIRREKKWATLVHEAGARVPKFQHELTAVFGLDPVERAVLTELLLRGPQTVAELRTRVPRMVPTLREGQVEAGLKSLRNVKGTELVREMPKAPGRREIRYAEVMSGGIPETADGAERMVIEAPVGNEEKRIAILEEEVRNLESALETLRREFQEFKSSFE